MDSQTETSAPGLDKIKVPVRIGTHDLKDHLIASFLGAVLTLFYFGLPALFTFLFTNSYFLAAGAFMASYGCFLAFTVWSISISEEGLHLKRYLGGPRFIPWNQITSIHEVSRKELILKGWLWPLFPPREFTPSLTSLGHFRINYNGRHIYYPPHDGDQFKKLISDKKPSSLAI